MGTALGLAGLLLNLAHGFILQLLRSYKHG
jgi:hypothetical protein